MQADEAIAVLIVRGAGRAFLAGADTSVPRPLTAENRPNLIRHGDANIALSKLLGRVDKPVVAALHGMPSGPAPASRSAALSWSRRKARGSAIRS